MSAAPGEDVIRGLRAAAQVAGRSPSGIEKLIDSGKLAAIKEDGGFVFARAALEALPPPHRPPALDALSTTGPGVAVSGAGEMASTGVHTPGASPSTGEQAPNATAPTNAGTVASQVFADLLAGHTLVQIVIDRSLSPEVVQGVHAQWRALGDVDGLSSPTTLDRLAVLERLLEMAAAEIGATTGVQALGEQLAVLAGSINTRLAGVERRRVGDDVRRELTGLRQRLAGLEQIVRALPVAPLLIAVPCSACGHPLAVVASCTGCGAGRANC